MRKVLCVSIMHPNAYLCSDFIEDGRVPEECDEKVGRERVIRIPALAKIVRVTITDGWNEEFLDLHDKGLLGRGISAIA